MMTMDIRQEIIDKHEHGAKVSELAKQYNRNPSTICTIVKNKVKKIKSKENKL